MLFSCTIFIGMIIGWFIATESFDLHWKEVAKIGWGLYVLPLGGLISFICYYIMRKYTKMLTGAAFLEELMRNTDSDEDIEKQSDSDEEVEKQSYFDEESS